MNEQVDEYGDAFAIPVPADGTSRLLISQAVKVIGWSLRETTGAAAAVVQLFSGGGAGGTQIAELSFATGEDRTHTIPNGGLLVNAGLFLAVVAGTVRGAVWVRARL